ncbi:MAG TPA: crosslink repair DNA glycosylase YcaQ family protein [Candidatus Atribacteria bacterium]|nr:crosslink repair DNA glycosylase YcaQ family protein [Candidatus Atribacteria bacterium]
MYSLTNKQARHFILLKHGLIGDYRFEGKEGVLAFVRQAGCIQFDPIDICGKNPELVLQSRVKGFTRQMLYELLYTDRKLLDYFDKNLAIISVDDWKYFSRMRRSFSENTRSLDEVEAVVDHIRSVIRERGYVSSRDLELDQKVDWYWSSTKLSRAALETMYFRGDLIILHKKGNTKYYALAEDHLPPELIKAEDPNRTELDHLKWRVLRRISAVGLLWNRASDAFLFISDFKAGKCNEVFKALLQDGSIREVRVEGIKDMLYCCSEDEALISKVLEEPELKGRTELLAPLDNILWDRKLINALFGFDYRWEVYTPEPQRKYGYYVLPILSGDRLIGRVEPVNQRKEGTLLIKNIWLEDGVRVTNKLKSDLDDCFRRFALFNGCRLPYKVLGGRDLLP